MPRTACSMSSACWAAPAPQLLIDIAHNKPATGTLLACSTSPAVDRHAGCVGLHPYRHFGRKHGVGLDPRPRRDRLGHRQPADRVRRVHDDVHGTVPQPAGPAHSAGAKAARRRDHLGPGQRGRVLTGEYLSHSIAGGAYGPGGAFVRLLLWVYCSAAVFYFGAELVGQQLGFHNLTPAVGCIDEAPPRLE